MGGEEKEHEETEEEERLRFVWGLILELQCIDI